MSDKSEKIIDRIEWAFIIFAALYFFGSCLRGCF